ncbi:glutamine amidotransferase [Candidatus Saccharibacteria bacterium]|nr:glutamine amidotransferase [Candidatus Saccharibacteria bacterium]MCB9834611.1 glutamine amidotransferase [Candidatus Nomurabacteria bacterium]
MKLKLIYLYPEIMNTYGDRGNVMLLEARAKDYGIEISTDYYTLGDQLDLTQYQLLFFGGGQDKGQNLIARDLMYHKAQLSDAVKRGIAGLLVCGGYQMLGSEVGLADGGVLEGLSILPVKTLVGKNRKIGNLLVQSEQFGSLVGFENHSGNTILDQSGKALAQTIKGYGNNDSAIDEGIIYRNLIGTYMHGPFLPKNIQVADWLLSRAVGKDLLTNTQSSLYKVSISARESVLGAL